MKVLEPKLKNSIIIVVTVVWATNFLSGLFLKDYEPDQTINAIFMAIVGSLFAIGELRGAGKSGGQHKDSGNDNGGSGGENSG